MWTGVPWRDMPKEYPPYQTCHRHFQQRSSDGSYEKLVTASTEILENAIN